jgi:hypothetical protein
MREVTSQRVRASPPRLLSPFGAGVRGFFNARTNSDGHEHARQILERHGRPAADHGNADLP